MEVTVTHDRLVISGRRRIQAPLTLRVRDHEYQVDSGGTRVVLLERTEPAG